ncbi:MAG: GH3 auxin-responsive promoter family protein, partial [Rhodospirillales bacterium]|nr:GH3 auxin-responsive promoter family protein [Rhodospirillales bacterium]
AFGEHLIGAEIEAALQCAATAVGVAVREYAVTPVYPAGPAEKGHHRFFVEFAEALPDGMVPTFLAALDSALAAENADYRDHRPGMDGPEVWRVPAGGFAAWMRARGKDGGQNKVPRVITDADLHRTLVRFLEQKAPNHEA